MKPDTKDCTQAQAQSVNADPWAEARQGFAIIEQLRERGVIIRGPWAGPPFKKPSKPEAQAEISERVHAAHPIISEETLRELVRRDLLHLGAAHFWRLGDENNGSTRRLDGRQWKRADNKGSDWHKLIGLADVVRHDRKLVLFVIEGSKDALAAAEIAQRCGILDQVGIVCALGSGYRPIANEIEQFKGRRVLLIGDNDRAGEDCANIVAAAMIREQVEFSVWNWSPWKGKAKDLYAALFESPESARAQIFRSLKNTFFSSPLPSKNSPVQRFNPSTNTVNLGLSDEEVLGIVHPFIVTERGTGNRQSFLLARAIKPRRLDEIEIGRIHDVWFEQSRSMLPPDADKTKSLEKFYRQINRVRFTESGLDAAWERAKSLKPPFIAAWDGNEKVALLAAFCRELQRNAGDRVFICPVNVVQRLLQFRFPPQAARLLNALEEERVIKCVDRGVPNMQGERGKPSFYRYLYPME